MSKEQSWSEAGLRSALGGFEAELRAAGKADMTVAAYVEHSDRFVNWLVGRYVPRPTPRRSEGGTRLPTSRYDPLHDYLMKRHEATVRMTFAEIEGVLGGTLPASARRYRSWWSNEQHGTHVHAAAWRNARRMTRNVNLGAGTVEFALSSEESSPHN